MKWLKLLTLINDRDRYILDKLQNHTNICTDSLLEWKYVETSTTINGSEAGWISVAVGKIQFFKLQY